MASGGPSETDDQIDLIAAELLAAAVEKGHLATDKILDFLKFAIIKKTMTNKF